MSGICNLEISVQVLRIRETDEAAFADLEQVAGLEEISGISSGYGLGISVQGRSFHGSLGQQPFHLGFAGGPAGRQHQVVYSDRIVFTDPLAA